MLTKTQQQSYQQNFITNLTSFNTLLRLFQLPLTLVNEFGLTIALALAKIVASIWLKPMDFASKKPLAKAKGN